MKRAPVKGLPSQDELLRAFRYDEMSGKIFRRHREGNSWFNSRFADSEAGYEADDGYIKIKYGGATYLAQRIIWKMMTGEDPKGSVDHIDGVKKNNLWENLRDATHDQNMWNTKLFHNNTSGYRGVSFIRAHGKWRAAISVGAKKKHLGYFETAEEAHAAFCDAVNGHRDEFARVA